MLKKAVATVKEDKAKAIDMFNKGEGGFKVDGVAIPEGGAFFINGIRFFKDNGTIEESAGAVARSRRSRATFSF